MRPFRSTTKAIALPTPSPKTIFAWVAWSLVTLSIRPACRSKGHRNRNHVFGSE
jgi:hypothetical protein